MGGTLCKKDKNHLEVVEMWRRASKTSRIQHKSNLKVLDEISEKIKYIVKGSVSDLLRHNEFVT